MRSFKHLTKARRDPKLASYAAGCKRPLEALGFFWVLCEIVGEHVGASNASCEACYPLKTWLRESYAHHKTFSSYTTRLAQERLITVSTNADKVSIKIPKLWKYKDDYTRKSGHTPDNERTNAGPYQISDISDYLNSDSDDLIRSEGEICAFLIERGMPEKFLQGEQDKKIIASWAENGIPRKILISAFDRARGIKARQKHKTFGPSYLHKTVITILQEAQGSESTDGISREFDESFD